MSFSSPRNIFFLRIYILIFGWSQIHLIQVQLEPWIQYILFVLFQLLFSFFLEGAERSTVRLDSKLEVLGSSPRKDKLKKLHRTHWTLVYHSSKLKYISKDGAILSFVGWVRLSFFQASVRSKSGFSLEYHIQLLLSISRQNLLNIAKKGQFGCQWQWFMQVMSSLTWLGLIGLHIT